MATRWGQANHLSRRLTQLLQSSTTSRVHQRGRQGFSTRNEYHTMKNFLFCCCCCFFSHHRDYCWFFCFYVFRLQMRPVHHSGIYLQPSNWQGRSSVPDHPFQYKILYKTQIKFCICHETVNIFSKICMEACFRLLKIRNSVVRVWKIKLFDFWNWLWREYWAYGGEPARGFDHRFLTLRTKDFWNPSRYEAILIHLC